MSGDFLSLVKSLFSVSFFLFYIPRPFRTLVIMAFNNFLSFLALTNDCLYLFFSPPSCLAIHLHKLLLGEVSRYLLITDLSNSVFRRQYFIIISFHHYYLECFVDPNSCAQVIMDTTPTFSLIFGWFTEKAQDASYEMRMLESNTDRCLRT